MSDQSAEGEHQVRGDRGEQCNYERCESVATVLVQFDETAPVQKIWFCAPHAGNSVKQHDDAHVLHEVTDS